MASDWFGGGNFTILNELRNHALVAIDLGDEPEIAQPPTQVVPPGATAGFDLIFSCDTPMPYKRTITYTVNGTHAFKFTASANVEPIDLSLSVEELSFRFADGNLEPSMVASVTLTLSVAVKPNMLEARFELIAQAFRKLFGIATFEARFVGLFCDVVYVL